MINKKEIIPEKIIIIDRLYWLYRNKYKDAPLHENKNLDIAIARIIDLVMRTDDDDKEALQSIRKSLGRLFPEESKEL